MCQCFVSFAGDKCFPALKFKRLKNKIKNPPPPLPLFFSLAEQKKGSYSTLYKEIKSNISHAVVNVAPSLSVYLVSQIILFLLTSIMLKIKRKKNNPKKSLLL